MTMTSSPQLTMKATIFYVQLLLVGICWLNMSHGFALVAPGLGNAYYPTAITSRTTTETSLKMIPRSEFLRRTTTGGSLLVAAASSQEEDLELTRQIILGHLKTTGSGSSDSEAVSEDKPDKSESKAVSETKDSTALNKDRPKNDLMIRAAFGEDVEMTPVWLFRQAGRHLPEYQAYKQKLNQNFLQLLSNPESVAECTMQPLRRYNLDAAILFSDILVVPQALGISVTMPGGVGIQVPEPLKEPSDITTRLPSIDEITPDFVQTKLGHVLAAVKQIRSQMAEEKKSIPLIGFSAAPWTLFFYMVGGSSKKNTQAGIDWMKQHPEETKTLLQLLTKVVIEYMAAQIEAGVHMMQVFEAMGMMMGDDDNFKNFALPCLKEIGQELKARYPHISLMVFARGACHKNPELAKLGTFDVITIDGSVDRATARQSVGVTLQGNYDPAELIVENGKTVDTVRSTAKQLLQELGPQRLIANLGEGLGGKESPELVDTFVNAIHAESVAMIRNAKQT